MYKHAPTTKYVAEFIGVYFLVLTIGCNVHTSSIGAALSIGSMLTVMIYALGSVSGGHFNPAVTLAVALRGGIVANDAIVYMIVQMIAGAMAATTYAQINGEAFAFAPNWHYTAGAALVVELIYSSLLCYVVLNVATTAADKGNQYFGLAIGFTVVSAAIAIGHVSGCSLNPAVSFGCLIAASMWHGYSSVHFWALYVLTPFLGAMIAAVAFALVRSGDTTVQKSRKLIQEPYQIPAPLEKKLLAIGLSCEHSCDRGGAEVDGCGMSFDREGVYSGSVYFAKKDHDIGLYHQTGVEINDDNQFKFILSEVSPDVHYMFFVATVHTHDPHMGKYSFKNDVRESRTRLIQLCDCNKCEYSVECSRCSNTDRAKEVDVPVSFTRHFLNDDPDLQPGHDLYISTMLSRTAAGGWMMEAIDKTVRTEHPGSTHVPLMPALEKVLDELRPGVREKRQAATARSNPRKR